MSPSDICFLTAGAMAAAIRSRVLSCRDVVEAHLAQIERMNRSVNAIVTLTAESALSEAKSGDQALADHADRLGPLHGVPFVIKDLHETAGVRTTYGSPLFSTFVPEADAILVERLKLAGAIALGKTNTPEFGAGSQTFNPVFGATRNPYDLTKTCGGSSGGSAVALACGMAPLATGSDMGGSLRNPASFCNVVGLRPAPGRVPYKTPFLAWSPLGVDGPMARTVADAALMLSVISGPDPRSPIAIQEPGSHFAQDLRGGVSGRRIAWPDSLGGLPFDPAVRAVVNAHRTTFETIGCRIEAAEPDLDGADEAFQTLRAQAFWAHFHSLDQQQRSQVKDTVQQELERGSRLTGPEIGRAELLRTAVFHRMREFFERYDFLVLPVAQVPPFDIGEPFVKEIDGIWLPRYTDWMKSCYLISVTGHPAISVPGGFTPEGLPVGIQIVGRHRGEWELLQIADAFEQATGWAKVRPGIAA